MKILGQIVSILPMALIISLPNQLLGHVPITQISTYITHCIDAMDEDNGSVEGESDNEEKSDVPDLSGIFQPGQYVRTVVTAVFATAPTDVPVIGRTRDGTVKASRRVELSLTPDKVNSGVQKSDLRAGFVSVLSRPFPTYSPHRVSLRRCQQLLRVSRTMVTFLILGCPAYLDF